MSLKFNLFVFNLSVLCAFSTNAEQIIEKNSVLCDSKQCAQIIPLFEDNSHHNVDKIIVYETSVKKKNFLARTEKTFSKKNNGGWQHIEIKNSDLKKKNGKLFHPIIGFGGSFSDTASLLYKSVPVELQKHIIDSYYSETGIEYTLGRVPMSSADFSCRDQNGKPALTNCDKSKSQYSYDDVANDFSLKHFTLQSEDINYKIPMILDALAQNKNLKLFASPWSAPAWMKDNNSMVHGGLRDAPAIKQTWANYFVSFLSQYHTYDVEFWGVTAQNEPNIEGVKQWWQTMYSTPDQQAEFIQNYLGPTLKNYNPNLKLIIHDDQLTTIKTNSMAIINNGTYSDAKQYIDGVGLHWYENELVPGANYKNIADLHSSLASIDQNQFVLGTEACMGYMPCNILSGCGPALGSIERGQSYAHDIIQDLNQNVSGWTDWNLLLDMSGGPNWAGNLVDAPILVNYERKILYKQPMYYYMGHFSKFIRPGAQMLNAKSEGPFPLEQVSYRVPATQQTPEYIAIVVLNRDITGRKFYIHDIENTRYINAEIPANSIQTYIYTLD